MNKNLFILLEIIITSSAVAMDIPLQPPSSKIELISNDGIAVTVPLSIALQSHTLADLLKGFEEGLTKSFATRINSTTLKIIAQIMESFFTYKNLQGKALLDTVISKNKIPEDQIFPLLSAFDFLGFLPGIRLIAQQISSNPANLEKITILIKTQQISYDTAQEIARIYYLLTKQDLKEVDPAILRFSIQEYIDYQPHIFAERKLENHLFLSKLRLNNLQGINKILTGITSLDLAENYLEQLTPNIFTGLINIQNLDLSHNRIHNISAGAFNELGNLKHLNLSMNKISILPSGIFNNLSHLESLNLELNPFTELTTGIFQGLINLKNLSLRACQLTQLPIDIFQDLVNLQYLNLSDNNLDKLTANIFRNNRNLVSLNIDENPLLHCDRIINNLQAGLPNVQIIFTSGNPWDEYNIYNN